MKRYLSIVLGITLTGCGGSGSLSDGEEINEPNLGALNEYAPFPEFVDPSLDIEKGEQLRIVVNRLLTDEGEQTLMCDSLDTFSGCYASHCVALEDTDESARNVISIGNGTLRQFQAIFNNGSCVSEPYGMLPTRGEWEFTVVGESGGLWCKRQRIDVVD